MLWMEYNENGNHAIYICVYIDYIVYMYHALLIKDKQSYL